MPRRKRLERDLIEQLLFKLDSLTNTPLGEIVRKIKSDIFFLKNSRHPTQEELLTWFKKIELIIQRLPKSHGQRFHFDTIMLQSIQESWNTSSPNLSGILIPKYDQEWGHEKHGLLAENREKTFPICLILIKGEEDINDVDLLSYPWMCHELGHNLLFRDDDLFRSQFGTKLNKLLRSLRLSAIADKGSASTKANNYIKSIESVWKPTDDHKNWAHELAIDVIALWTCGPAYLAVFLDELEHESIDPYEIVQTHPPYEVRIFALMKTARSLGWGHYTSGISNLMKEWQRSKRHYRRVNSYITLTNPLLIEAGISSALSTCKAKAIPQCTRENIQQIRNMLNQGETPDFGIELILAAWLVREERQQPSYEQWERDTISDLLTYITQ